MNEDTTEWGVGPVQLDVAMARRHGWSESAIDRVVDKLREISIAEARNSHCMGPVKDCPCEQCDRRTPNELMTDLGALRTAWCAAGVWP